MIKVAITALTLIAIPGLALAQDMARAYGTLGYSRIDTDQATLGAITARAGFKVLPFLGIEGEAGIGVDDEPFEISIGGAGVFELKHDIAAYAVGFLPISENIELFARAGVGSTSIKASVPRVMARGDGESFNYGAGANLFFGANGVRADWTRRDFEDGAAEADVWSLSYIRRF